MKKIAFCFSFFFISFSFSFGQSWDWVKLIQGGDTPMDHFLASDDTGNVYYCDPYFDLDKFDKNDNFLWQWSPTGLSTINGASYAIAIYRGYEYITGSFDDSLIIGVDTLLTPNPTNTSLVIAKFNSSGQPQWAKQINDGRSIINEVEGSSVCDSKGNVFVMGYFIDTAIFYKDTLVTLPGYTSLLLAKYAPNGTLLWAKQFNQRASTDVPYPISMATDEKGSVYGTGEYRGTIILGKDTLPADSNLYNFFLVKYDSDGSEQWAQWGKIKPGTGLSQGLSVSSDGSGNVYAAGNYTQGSFTLGSFTFGSAYNVVAFLAKFDSAGNVDWATSSVQPNWNNWRVNSVTSDSLKNIYLHIDGYTSPGPPYTIQFGTVSLSSNTLPCAIFQFDSSGSAVCGSLFSEGIEDDGSGICSSPSGNYVYLGGDIDDTSFFGQDTILSPSGWGEAMFVARWLPCGTKTDAIKELRTMSEGIRVFPNPFTNSTTISIIDNGQLAMDNYLELYDLTGQKLKQIEFTGNSYTLSAEGLAKGMYFVRVFDKENNVIGTSKIVVQ